MNGTTRREFLTSTLTAAMAAAALGLGVAGCSSQPSSSGGTGAGRVQAPTPAAGATYLSVAHGADPAAITRAAVAALGGIERFVKKGHAVVIKPNICVDYHPPEYAATTNPQVVAAMVELCLSAGAKSVKVMDNPFGGTPETAYAISGIGDAVQSAGGVMEVMSPIKFASYDIPQGKDIKSWRFYRTILEADVLINLPIAKTHSLARLSLGIKNLLGTINNAQNIHENLGQRAADLLSLLRPTLTVMDAYRILAAHGPTGGSLDDVKETHQVIVSHDPVAVDAYSATLFDLKGADVAYVQAAADMGLGTLDLASIKIEETNA